MFFGSVIIWFMILFVSSGSKVQNVILLLADDLGFADISVSPYSDKAMWITKTPSIEKLAREGVSLLGYRNAASLCSPSRMAILTGIYPYRFESIGILHAGSGTLPRVPTIATSLRDAGFHNHMVGKWHIGGATNQDLWHSRFQTDCLKPGPIEHGFHTALIRPENKKNLEKICCSCCKYDDDYNPETEKCQQIRCGTMYSTQAKWFVRLSSTNTSEAPSTTWVTQSHTDECIRFLQEQRRNDRFFLNVWFNAPHAPVEAHIPYISDAIQAKPLTQDPKSVQFSAEYISVIQAMDAGIGQILHLLETRRLHTNTLVIFTSDNGPEEGLGIARPFRGRKRSLFEGGTAVPMIFRLPGVVGPAGSKPDFFMSSVDIFPTILAACGIDFPQPHANDPWPSQFDQVGRNYRDLRLFDAVNHWSSLIMQKESSEIQTRLEHIRNQRVTFWANELGHFAARRRELKLWVHPKKKRLLLFNLTADPGERTDLSSNTALAQDLAFLRSSLNDFKNVAPRRSFRTDNPLNSSCGHIHTSHLESFVSYTKRRMSNVGSGTSSSHTRLRSPRIRRS
eukprot:CAMPEP_0197318168 /NCGR_PEP_ID=MMETSP0891-20130614/49767_1 /TAXON_ID=44058 ORGANISM="Aureoumbra lagunensis, Strain CCMP1510" /NCGR_SAMPLE_ID=MMETSP0891 /ASSEMBLY_ACC=CAM_ASM_000534 /LENGTH=564 /DNA_ID=CAMNT_0042808487 /DNA_START=106 /DNA_END=1797 /DNA_ORIENTATION=+